LKRFASCRPRPSAVVTRPLTVTPAAVGASWPGIQKPLLCENEALAEVVPAADCPPVPETENAPFELVPPPAATTDFSRVNAPPAAICAATETGAKTSNTAMMQNL
jgi:hypothetical protein